MVDHLREPNDSLITNIRWFKKYCHHGFRDCFKFHREDYLQVCGLASTTRYVFAAGAVHSIAQMKPINYLGFLQLFLAKLLLEVCGAAGAIWGCSDIVSLRNEDTQYVWRIVSLVIFGIFAIRFWWHSKHYFEHDREFPPIKLKHRRHHKMPFFQIFSAKFILEVLGAAGAIWGPAEVAGFRNEENRLEWQIACGVVGVLFGVRWMVAINSYCLCFENFKEKRPILSTLLSWSEVLLVRFVLVVLGAAGATWGFSEVVALRTSETNSFWRPMALSMGFVFFIRWILQTCAYAGGVWEEDKPPSEESQELKVDLQETDDLQLQETSLSTPTGTDPEIEDSAA